MTLPTTRHSPLATRHSPLATRLAIALTCLVWGHPVSATCPINTDNGLSYDLVFPKAADSAQPGTLVVMSEESATVAIDDPCGGTTCFPTATTPCVYSVCNGAQFTGTGPSSNFRIRVVRTDNAIAKLHVVFKFESSTDTLEDAFLAIPSDPERRGSSYWTLGQRGAVCSGCGYTSNWAALATSAMTLNFRDCGGTGTSQSPTSNQVFQQGCSTSSARADDTGNNVYSSGGQAFSLISGATCAYVPSGVGTCEPLAEMLPPASWAGTEYFVTEFNKPSAGTPGDLVRIVATGSSTNVSFAAVTGGTIVTNNASGHKCSGTSGHSFANAGDWCDILVEKGAQISVTSGSAVFVGQYMKGFDDTGVGDAAFSLVLPTAKFRCGGPFFSFDDFDQDTTGNGSYVNIVAPTSAIAGITLDGSTLSSGTTCAGYSRVDFGSTGYSWTKCLLANPGAGGTQHVLDSGSTPMAAYVYGQNAVKGAYAYPSGMGF